MSFRYTKRIRILPFVWLNLTHRGISFSFGTRGAKVTTGRGGTHVGVGLPGTGIFFRKRVK